jgi:hypothetical protein
MYMQRLSPIQVEILTALAKSQSLSSFKNVNASNIFSNAVSKFRLMSGNYKCVEGDARDTYSVAWFKSDEARTMQLIERYQLACDAAENLFWAIREGI